MKRNIAIFTHSIGNHSVEQIIYHGRKVFQGTAKEARKELIELRKGARDSWRNASTDDTMSEYVDYYMSRYFAVDMDNGKWFIE